MDLQLEQNWVFQSYKTDQNYNTTKSKTNTLKLPVSKEVWLHATQLHEFANLQKPSKCWLLTSSHRKTHTSQTSKNIKMLANLSRGHSGLCQT